MTAVVLDLPQAVAEAAPLLAAEGMGDRVVHCAGDVLTDDLVTDGSDLILAFSLVHHFDADTNRRLPTRCAEMAVWQRGAGLVPRKPMRLILGQGPVLQIAERPVR